MLKVARLFQVALTIMLTIGGLTATQNANAQSYCTPGWWGHDCNTGPYLSWITNVTVGSTSNPTPNCGISSSSYYTFFSGVNFTMLSGSPSTVTVQTRFTDANWPATYNGGGGFKMWIDVNRDGIFSDVPAASGGELFMSGPSTLSPATYTRDITIPANVTPGVCRMRCMTEYYQYGFGPCSSTMGETEDYNITILPPLADASPTSVAVTNPGDGSTVASPVAQGTYNVGFTLTNIGVVTMTQCSYTASVTRVADGSNVVPPVSAPYNTPIPGNTSVNIPLVSNLDITNPLTPYRIQVSIPPSSVRSQFATGDNNPNNNVLDAFVGPALSGGEYWVGGTQTPTNWFSHPNQVAIALTYGGILGPVTFNVRPGSYASTQGQIGQVTAQVQGVPGASPSRRVTFRRDPAVPGNSVFVSPNNGPGPTNYMFTVVGNVYTTFDGITFQADGAANFARFFWLANQGISSFTRDLVFNNCTFNGVNLQATGLAGPDNYLVMSDLGNVTDGLVFTNNRFNNGDVHLWLDGGFGSVGSSNTTLTNNVFTDFYSRGAYLRNLQLPSITRNTMTTQSVNFTPVTALDVESNRVGGRFSANKISFNRTGTGFRFANNFNTGSPAEIHNNMIRVGNGLSNTTYALTAQNFLNTNIYYNTLLCNAPATTLAAALHMVNPSVTGTRVYNNIINNTSNGYAYSITSGGAPTESDFNNIRNSTCSNTSSFTGLNVGFFAGLVRNSPSLWNSATGRDLNSIFSNRYSQATFLPAPNDMYIGDINRFLRGTQAINNLDGGNTNVDIDGTLRRNPPMMGAHELVPAVAFSGTTLDSTCVNTTSTLASGPVISSLRPFQYTLPMADPFLAPATAISYQWQSNTSRGLVNGPKFGGVTTSTLTINNTDEFDAGTYTLVATLNDGAREYNGIDLTQSMYTRQLNVNQPVEIGRQPISQVVCKGSDFVLNFTTKRGTSISYQWFKDGELLKANTIYPFASAVEGVNNYVLTVRNVDFSASGRYVCRIKTTCGATSADTVIFTQEAIVYVAKGTQIDKEPISQVVSAGSTAKFEVAAAEATGSFGISPVRYQWSKNGVVISDNGRYGGATSPVLTVRNVVAADAGNYSVKVIGSCGEATSQTFTLTLGTATATAVAAKVDACQSSDATLKVNASTSVPNLNLEYRWFRGDVQLFDGTKYAGTNTNSLVIKNADPADAGMYKAVATASPAVNISASANVELSLYAATQITSGLTSKKVCDGTKETLSVTATGGGNMTYQWKKDGQNIAGATSSSYEIASMNAAAAGDYTVEATGACGTVASTATITYSAKAGIVVNTPTVSAKAGTKIVLSVSANEDGFTTYKWFFNGTEVAGATTNEFVKFNASNADAGKYYCEVTNACGTSKSDEMTVAVTLSTSVDESIIAEGLKLYNNEPNPFASSTAIRFELPKPAFVTLSISDVFGREVAKLAANSFDAGIHTLNFVPSEFGLANGVYYYTLTTSGTSLTEKMLFVK